MTGTGTRSRILEAAWALVWERGTTSGVTGAGIAAAVGVARGVPSKAIFGGKSGITAKRQRASGPLSSMTAKSRPRRIAALNAQSSRSTASSARPSRSPA